MDGLYSPMEDKLSSYPVVIRQDVTWGDMDAHGHVNNVTYFRYMENARVEFYSRINKYEFERKTGITFVIAATSCKFISALTYPDKIAVGARVREIGAHHMIMEYLVLNDLQDSVAAIGEATIVALNITDNTKAPFPAQMKEYILGIQQGIL